MNVQHDFDYSNVTRMGVNVSFCKNEINTFGYILFLT